MRPWRVVDEPAVLKLVWDRPMTTAEIRISLGWDSRRAREACVAAAADGYIRWIEDPTGIVLWFSVSPGAV